MQESGRNVNPQAEIESLIELLLNAPDRLLRRRVLKAARAERNRAPQPETLLRLKQGVIQQAVFSILAESEQPMRAQEIRLQLESRFARAITMGAVTSCLAEGAKDEASPLTRVGWGLYAWQS